MIIQEKKILRKQISSVKKLIPLEEKIRRSDAVMERLLEHPEYKKSKKILFYWSMDDEVFTKQTVIQAYNEGKEVYLPVVEGDNLRIRLFEGVAAMVAGESFSIPEPSTDSPEVFIDDIDLVVVPGVAFDAQCSRMGRGKGYYDRLLSAATKEGRPYTIGVCFDFQLVPKVPVEECDKPLDCVISETSLYHK